jgi:hypothetical protein
MIKISNSKRDLSLALINDFNANPFIPDNHGKNTLHLLIAKARKKNAKEYDNMLPVFEKILQHKNITKHINDKDENGNTALHIAMTRRDLDYIIPLINAGADLNIKNNNELSPVDILKSDNDTRIEILRKILSPWNDDKLYIRKKGNIEEIIHPCSSQNKKINQYLIKNNTYTQEECDLMDEKNRQTFESIASFDSSTFNQNPDLILEEINKNLPNKNLDSFEGKGKSNTL